MTTTVTVGIAGNKKCTVRVNGAPHQDCLMDPGTFATFGIHGDQTISVVEHGEFVETHNPTRPIPLLIAMPRESSGADLEDPPACPGCGLMAGCCDSYPNCPGGEASKPT